MPDKPIVKRGFKTRAENLAIEYREKMGISKFRPLDAFKLAEYLNVPVFSVEEVFENHLDPAFILMNKTENFDALWMFNEDGDKIILHNSKHSNYRQQSNLMHELSHIILEHTIPDEIGKICFAYNLHYYNKEQEYEAKFFGACLQITKPSILWVLKEKWTEEKISEYYSASLEMVRFRMNVIGSAKRNGYRRA